MGLDSIHTAAAQMAQVLDGSPAEYPDAQRIPQDLNNYMVMQQHLAKSIEAKQRQIAILELQQQQEPTKWRGNNIASLKAEIQLFAAYNYTVDTLLSNLYNNFYIWGHNAYEITLLSADYSEFVSRKMLALCQATHPQQALDIGKAIADKIDLLTHALEARSNEWFRMITPPETDQTP